jgi:hypothetical protein
MAVRHCGKSCRSFRSPQRTKLGFDRTATAMPALAISSRVGDQKVA